MSYDKNLGRVKGDTGTTYYPEIYIDPQTLKQYIRFTSSDGSPVPANLQEQEFMSRVYYPSLDNQGNLSFTLQTDAASSVVVGNVKGEKGDSTIRIESCTRRDLPSTPLTDIQKATIYVITDTDDAYFDAVVWSDTKNDYIYLENKIRFDNYYTKRETYNKSEVYNRDEIAGQLGTIVEQQNAIVNILGDTGAIIIPDNEYYIPADNLFYDKGSKFVGEHNDDWTVTNNLNMNRGNIYTTLSETGTTSAHAKANNWEEFTGDFAIEWDNHLALNAYDYILLTGTSDTAHPLSRLGDITEAHIRIEVRGLTYKSFVNGAQVDIERTLNNRTASDGLKIRFQINDGGNPIGYSNFVVYSIE